MNGTSQPAFDYFCLMFHTTRNCRSVFTRDELRAAWDYNSDPRQVARENDKACNDIDAVLAYEAAVYAG